MSVPFLYIGGTYYDLTTITGVRAGATPVAINQAGQVLLNDSAAGTTYVITPIAGPPPPAQGTVAVAVGTNLANQPFTVSGVGCTAGTYTMPQTLQWTSGSSCTVAFPTPYTVQAGIRNVFVAWQDGSTANPRTFAAPPYAELYTATFKTQYLMTVVVNPAQGGTVTGAGWWDASGIATLMAAPVPGYRFTGWSAVSGPVTANPATVQMNGPQWVSASFAPSAKTVPPGWTATRILSGGARGFGINSFGQVAGQFSGRPFLWTPVTANSTTGAAFDLSSSLPIFPAAAAAVNDRGQVLMTGVQCCTVATPGPTALWTPTVPQGTTGSTITFGSETSNPRALWPALNNFGQVAISVSGSPMLWTPTSANGVSGTYTPDAAFQGLRALNSYGQAIVVPGDTGLLFTPSTRNGAVGTFTVIGGLPGAMQTTAVGINDSGVIVGYSCVAQPASQCRNYGFVWTPNSSNAISGNTAEMPLPLGFVSVTPTAINAGRAIIGTMSTDSGFAVPFLYTGGTYYELTSIDGVPPAAVPAAINTSGQVLLNDPTTGSVYLVTARTGSASKVGTYNSGRWRLDTDASGIFNSPGDQEFFLGWTGATVVTGDWNGDGRTKAGVYSSGYWFLDYDGNGVWDNGVKDKLIAWGWAGASPMVGDWNGDGRTKIGVYSNGFWFLDYNGDYLWDGGIADKQVGWGWAGVTPILGDWNGNGKTKIGVYVNGFWFLDYDGNYFWDGGVVDKQAGWGWAGVTPIVGDWNGDGRAKIGVYAGGYWYLDIDGNYLWQYPGNDKVWAMGWTGTTPVIGDWNGDGKSKAGAFINGYWYLDYDGNGAFEGGSDRIYALGGSSDMPTVGKW
jgi:hypothetical protein